MTVQRTRRQRVRELFGELQERIGASRDSTLAEEGQMVSLREAAVHVSRGLEAVGRALEFERRGRKMEGEALGTGQARGYLLVGAELRTVAAEHFDIASRGVTDILACREDTDYDDVLTAKMRQLRRMRNEQASRAEATVASSHILSGR